MEIYIEQRRIEFYFPAFKKNVKSIDNKTKIRLSAGIGNNNMS